jgi:hypothetical protein
MIVLHTDHLSCLEWGSTRKEEDQLGRGFLAIDSIVANLDEGRLSRCIRRPVRCQSPARLNTSLSTFGELWASAQMRFLTLLFVCHLIGFNQH